MRGAETIGYPIAITAVVYMQRRGSDLDNRWKIAGDALERAGVIEDDVLISRLHLERRLDSRDPRIEIEITRVYEPELIDALGTKHQKSAA